MVTSPACARLSRIFMKTILVTFGTRPETIKMAPLVAALRARPADFRCVVCATAQHRDMLDQVLPLFGLEPDVDLDLMRPGQTLNEVTSRVIAADGRRDRRLTGADVVVVQGDTTTAMGTALAAFQREVPVAHVEAGLRSGRLDAPFPEEMNRVVIDKPRRATATRPRPGADAFLEPPRAWSPTRRLVTGNTAIDALLDLRGRLDALDLPIRGAPRRARAAGAHHGPPARVVRCSRCATCSEPCSRWPTAHPDVTFVYPVHPNPQRQGAGARAPDRPQPEVLIDPVHYGELAWLLDRAELVISDSGGLQEESPTLGKPLLVLREVTERPEVVDAGAALLVGTDRARIEREATRLLGEARRRARRWAVRSCCSATAKPSDPHRRPPRRRRAGAVGTGQAHETRMPVAAIPDPLVHAARLQRGGEPAAPAAGAQGHPRSVAGRRAGRAGSSIVDDGSSDGTKPTPRAPSRGSTSHVIVHDPNAGPRRGHAHGHHVRARARRRRRPDGRDGRRQHPSDRAHARDGGARRRRAQTS